MRLRTTHDITVYGGRVVGENELGVEQTKPDHPIAQFRGRYRPQGEGLVREQRSSRVDSSPVVVTYPTGRDPETGQQVKLVDVLEVSQRIDVDGVPQRHTITRVNPQFGRGPEPERITLDLEAVTDGG